MIKIKNKVYIIADRVAFALLKGKELIDLAKKSGDSKISILYNRRINR